MNWKFFLPLLAAALALGHSLVPPRLAPPIPLIQDPSCDYALALNSYLLAYAYAREVPERARGLLWTAENARLRCATDTTVLEARILALKSATASTP